MLTIATAAPITIAPTNPPMTMNRPQVTPWVWARLAASAHVAPPTTTTPAANSSPAKVSPLSAEMSCS